MSYPRYPAYKDSGVEWLGEVPEHWRTLSLKSVLVNNDSGVWGEDGDDDDTIVLRSTEQLIDGTWNIVEPARRKLTESERRSALLTEGDLVITKSSGSSQHIGKTSFVDSKIADLHCCFSNFMQRLRTKDNDISRLLFYLLNNKIGREQFGFLSSTTTGLANLNAALIGQVQITLPPNEELATILTFLDRETAKIAALIAKQQRLIALLQEKRQALIAHAVTKGLNPDAPMRDSGVEWLGEIPAHWRMTRLKFVAEVRTGLAKGKDYGSKGTLLMPYLRVANVQDGYLDLNDVAEIVVAEEEVDRYLLRAGDVLMNEGGDNDKLGRGAVWGGQIDPCLHQNHVFAVRPHQADNAHWISTITQTNYGKFYFYSKANQSTNLASISQRNVAELPLVMPPRQEREDILRYIDYSTARIKELFDKAQRAIELLREHRTSLISAAVTGKIDVREAGSEAGSVAAPPPEPESSNVLYLSAGELLKLPSKKRERILTRAVAEAEAVYRTDRELTDFEAFAEADLYDDTPEE